MPARRERGLFTEEPASYLPKEELERLWNLELKGEEDEAASSEHSSSRESLEESEDGVRSGWWWDRMGRFAWEPFANFFPLFRLQLCI